MSENDARKNCRPRKSFYFQSKVSVQRVVLQEQAPYQHCDSCTHHNLQDQRFQKILSLRASPEKFPTFQAAQTKVLRVHFKPVKPCDFQWQLKLLSATPLSFTSLYMTLAETVLRMFMDQTKKMIYVEG